MRGEASDHSPVAEPTLRIALITDTYHPLLGGGETHARLMAETMTQMGHAVTVYTQRRLAESPRHEYLNGVEIVRVGPSGFTRLGKYLMIPGALRRLVSLHPKYDVLYVCGLRVQGLTGMFANLPYRRSVVVLRSESCGELSGAYLRDGRAAPLRVLLKLATAVRNAWYRQADAFLAISRAIADEYREQGVDPERIVCIPNGVDFSRFFPANGRGAHDLGRRRAALGLPQTGRLVAYAGKLNHGKGLETLVSATAELAKTDPQLYLVLIGGGAQQSLSCEDALRQQVQDLGLSDRVVFTGYTERVPDYLQAATVFVLPSESEAFGLVLVEAMACGLPCIGTNVGGIPDILVSPELGQLIPPRDVPALIEALRSLLENPAQASAMAERGRASVLARFDARHVAQQHLDLFASLSARKARS